MTLPSGAELDYSIDPSGRRVAKRRDGDLVQSFIYGQGPGPLAELTPDGTIRSRFVYATRSSAPDYMVRDGRTYRILTDQLGSPRVVVDTESGAVVQEIDYDEFGRVLRDTNPGFQPFGYAGGLYDADTGLVRFGARDYDPDIGRWTTRDPIGFTGGDTNLYGYVLNDPINWTDPSGLLPGFIEDTAGWAGDRVSDVGNAVAGSVEREIKKKLVLAQELIRVSSGFTDGATEPVFGGTEALRESILGADSPWLAESPAYQGSRAVSETLRGGVQTCLDGLQDAAGFFEREVRGLAKTGPGRCAIGGVVGAAVVGGLTQKLGAGVLGLGAGCIMGWTGRSP